MSAGGAGRGAAGQRVAWSLCLVLAVSTGILGYLAFRRTPPGTPTPAPIPAASPAGPADVSATAATTPGGIVLESKGYLIPAHRIQISPKINGMIRRLRVQEGQRVTRGDVLAELEDTDYRAEYERSKGLRDAAWQRLLELYVGFRPRRSNRPRRNCGRTTAQLPQAKAEWERNASLVEHNAVPRQDFETCESKYRAMLRRTERLQFALKLMEDGPREERIEAARSDVRQMEGDVSKARWKLDNCTIRAPISGIILTKNAEEGNIVNPIAFQGSFSICDMADLSDLEVDLSIQERDIARIFPEQQCRIRGEAYPKREYRGWVSRLMPIADRAKGAVPVRVKVAVPEEEEGVYLKPEMAVTVSFYGAAHGGVEFQVHGRAAGRTSSR